MDGVHSPLQQTSSDSGYTYMVFRLRNESKSDKRMPDSQNQYASSREINRSLPRIAELTHETVLLNRMSSAEF